ncbi:hypothetical protein [Nocardia sp. NPDC049149]|uniref:hypothetical protein n=1 Tax=Nocardia sp. NPDC049149 TaxID=3364315 RepID=UPI00372128D8
MGGFWDGFLDVVGDVAEFALPVVGTVFGPGGRMLGGAVGNLIDEALDGDIHSFQDFAETAGMGAAEGLLGGMAGGVVGKLVGKLGGKVIPSLSNLSTDTIKLGFKPTRASDWSSELFVRTGQILANPGEIGKGIGAGAGLLVGDAIRGEDKPNPVVIPVRDLV